jgi:uncharacterized protein (TIGR00730 family)
MNLLSPIATTVSTICVFCSASNAIDAHYLDMGEQVGSLIASKGYRLVYGGGNCGIMGAVARGALKKNGHVIGVFPKILKGLEEENNQLTEFITVLDMHTRKQTMFDLADAFIILPGGFGTLDETFEVITWKQLHTHQKPIIFYNYQEYWNLWIELSEHIIGKQFAHSRTRTLYQVESDIEKVFSYFCAH